MNRLSTMARFIEPEAKEEKAVSKCHGCGYDLYTGEQVLLWNDKHYCDGNCVIDTINFDYITLGEK